MRYSIVQYVPPCDNSKCGYCENENSSKCVQGYWAHNLATSYYNNLLDRGLRRSGCYLYKPIINNTCCPQYTIRLDVNKFMLSRSQKRVLRHMNDFIRYDKKPKVVISESANCSFVKEDKLKPMEKHTVDHSVSNIESKKKNDFSDELPRKKKLMRKERAIQRMIAKGINVEEVQRKRHDKEVSRRRSLESYISPHKEDFAHKLEVRLITVGSKEFENTIRESFNVYQKYQTIVHNDTDCSLHGYKNFLANSPLFSDEIDSDSKEVALGSYHYQYLLDGKIIAVGVVDILPRCLSATYFYYDPDYNFLSLGTYSALREIALTRSLASERPSLHYYYMGYYIDSCAKMRYKGNFRPADLLCDTSFTWVPFELAVKRMRDTGKEAVAFAPDSPRPSATPVGLVMCLYEGTIMPYEIFRQRAKIYEIEQFMEDYAHIVGPIAMRMLLYRSL